MVRRTLQNVITGTHKGVRPICTVCAYTCAREVTYIHRPQTDKSLESHTASPSMQTPIGRCRTHPSLGASLGPDCHNRCRANQRCTLEGPTAHGNRDCTCIVVHRTRSCHGNTSVPLALLPVADFQALLLRIFCMHYVTQLEISRLAETRSAER